MVPITRSMWGDGTGDGATLGDSGGTGQHWVIKGEMGLHLLCFFCLTFYFGSTENYVLPAVMYLVFLENVSKVILIGILWLYIDITGRLRGDGATSLCLYKLCDWLYVKLML